MSEHQHGPPPELEAGNVGFGAKAIAPHGVRVMLKGFSVMLADDAQPVAYIDVDASGALLALEVLGQASRDAHRGIAR